MIEMTHPFILIKVYLNRGYISYKWDIYLAIKIAIMRLDGYLQRHHSLVVDPHQNINQNLLREIMMDSLSAMIYGLDQVWTTALKVKIVPKSTNTITIPLHQATRLKWWKFKLAKSRLIVIFTEHFCPHSELLSPEVFNRYPEIVWCRTSITHEND